MPRSAASTCRAFLGNAGKGWGGLAILLVLVIVRSADAIASDLSDFIDTRATLETETAAFLRDGDLQKWDLTLEPQLQASIGSGAKLTAIGRIRYEAADRLEPGGPFPQSPARSGINRQKKLGESGTLELRELYADINLGSAFLRLGKQQVVWGEADGLRVLDVVNPLEHREFVLPEFEDRRIPLWTANLEVPLGSSMLQLLWIPDRTYDVAPQAGSAFAFTTARLVPQPPAALIGSGPVIVDGLRRPDRTFADDDYGARLNFFVGGWDLSLNYLYHFQDQPVFFREALSGGGLAYRPRYERTQLVGASASNAFGKLTLRAELGYSTDRFFFTNDPSDIDGVFETSDASYVIGLDYQHSADTFISGQIFQSYLTSLVRGAARDRIDTNFSILASREFRNDSVKLEALAIHNVNDVDGVVQLDVSYRLASSVVVTFGADVFYGERSGLFGQFDEADRLRFAIEFGF